MEAAGGLENFEREAETWVNLGLHPHTVSCYYVRRIDNSPVVFAEYVAGGSLSNWIYSRRLYRGGTQTSLKRILDIAIQFACGLHYAHEKGLVHQDVKPANVMMTAEGVVKVTDFGLANTRNVVAVLNLPVGNKSQHGVPSRKKTLIVNGGSAMTPAYCSPEQANRKSLTRRTDLWSWAVSVLEMFQGERSWASGTVAAEALEYYLEMEIDDPQLPQMPVQVAHLLRHCFRENPDQRPHNMLDAANELQDIYEQVIGEVYPRQQHNAGKDIADSLNNRAVSLLDLGKESEALQLWDQALKVQPHHPESTYNRGLTLWRAARINDDILVNDMEQVQQTHALSWVAHYLLGLVHLERDDCSAAIKILEDIQGEEAQQQEVKAALAFAQERLPNSWGVSKINYLQLGFPHLNDGLVASPEEFSIYYQDRIIKIWEVATRCCLCTLEGHTHTVNSAYVSLDEQFVVSRDHDLKIKLWEVATSRCLHTLQDKYANRAKNKLVFSIPPREEAHAETSGEGNNYFKTPYIAPMMLSQVLTTETFLSTSQIYEQEIKQAQAALQTGDYILAVQHLRKARLQPGYNREAKAIKAWTSLYTRLPRKVFLGAWEGMTLASTAKINRICLSADSRFILSRNSDGSLVLWEVETGRQLHRFGGNTNRNGAVCLSPDNRFALSYGDDVLKLWDVATGECLRAFSGHTELVDAMCFSADNQFILSGSYDQTVKLWDVTTGVCLHTFAGHAAPVTSVYLSANSEFGLSGSRDNTLKLWEIATGNCLHTFTHPDIKHTEDPNKLIGVWDDSGIYQAFDPGVKGLSSVCLSLDGRFALSGSGDTIKLWEMATAKCLHTFLGHTDSVVSVCFSSDSQFILSGSADKTLKLWDIATGNCLRTLEGHTDIVNSVFLSPDGRFALSGSLDKTVKFWMLDWDLDEKEPTDWDEGASVHLENFLILHTPYAAALPENHQPIQEEITLRLTHRGTPICNEKNFQKLLNTLGYFGYGWLKPEGVRHQLEKMTGASIFTNNSQSLTSSDFQENFPQINSQQIELTAQSQLDEAIAYYQQSDFRCQQLGDLQGAIEDLTKAIQINPNYLEAYNNRGFIQAQLGNLQGALADYNQALVIHSMCYSAYEQSTICLILRNRSSVLLNLGDLQGAIDDLTRVIQLNSDDYIAYSERGYIFYKLGNLQLALQDINTAIQLNPNNAVNYCHRGNIYAALEDHSHEIKDFSSAIQLDSKYVLAYCNRGIAYYKSGNLQKAIDDLNIAIKLDPNCTPAYFNRSMIYYECGNLQKAKADLLKASEIFLAQGDTANYQQVMNILKNL
ncbi:MAG: tetratricopeptide repeat protein [Nostoc sp. TH1S01]|nr:tetratricopeptide repeat protein [Nostoc sp. TH1S01]